MSRGAWVRFSAFGVSPGRDLAHEEAFFNDRPDLDRGKHGADVDPFSLAVLLGLWVVASSASGFVLAALGKRLHPGLSRTKLWLFYTVLMATLVAVVFLIAWF